MVLGSLKTVLLEYVTASPKLSLRISESSNRQTHILTTAVCLLNNLVTKTTNGPDETDVHCGIFKSISLTSDHFL